MRISVSRVSTSRRRAFNALKNYFRREWEVEAVLNFDEVPPFIRRHLIQVYFSLLGASAFFALGFYTCPGRNSQILYTIFATFVSIFCFYKTAPWQEHRRVCLFLIGAFFGGASFAPWFTWFFSVDAGFVVASILGASAGFCCFLASSIWTKRFDLVYYIALLLCSPLVVVALVCASAALGGEASHWAFQLHAGLLWFMVYVAVYSQEVVLKARRGDVDYVKHAITLITDFPAVLFHVLKLLKRRTGY
ncbi:Bax inhibitor 1 [Sesamum alatum]|uniref:Bax inhibitor 1 n=1 Tax=Sesamum alatum TaxID=300844 RepID=A0AAE1XMH3_9LAMI|nr:Bax inhibitor 1 [Sesamum alatum]